MSTSGHRCRAGQSAGMAIAALALLVAHATACGGSAATATNDLAFTHSRCVAGRSWAAVVWTAGSQSNGAIGSGVTMLEIRGGEIHRETLYCNSSNVPF